MNRISNGIKIQSVSTSRTTLDYFCFGSGAQTLLILPGAAVQSVMPAADLIAAAYECFSEAYTVYVFEIRRNIPNEFRIQDMADDLAAAMQKLVLQNADVFGCSLGGMIAQALAIFHPELVHKMILGSTLARQNAVSIDTCEEWCRLAEQGDPRLLNRAVREQVYSSAYLKQFQEAFLAAEALGTPEELRRFSHVIQACRTFDMYDQLDRIVCPVLVLGSEADCTLSAEASLDLAQKLHCPFYMYPGYSHAVYDEAPDYKARMLRFFKKGRPAAVENESKNRRFCMNFRYAGRNDVPLILQFIQELAAYEQLSAEVVATPELLEEWLFDRQKAEVIFALEDETEVGFALFFHNFSTFLGRSGIYLEDLFVKPEYRGKGYGKGLIAQLAKIAVERKCGRLEWCCLDWNQPSIDFYLSLGAMPMNGWTTYRVAGDTLRTLSEQ